MAAAIVAENVHDGASHFWPPSSAIAAVRPDVALETTTTQSFGAPMNSAIRCSSATTCGPKLLNWPDSLTRSKCDVRVLTSGVLSFMTGTTLPIQATPTFRKSPTPSSRLVFLNLWALSDYFPGRNDRSRRENHLVVQDCSGANE